MAISLTRDELFPRFAECQPRLEPVLNQAIREAIVSLSIRQDEEGIHVNLHQTLGTLIASSFLGIVKLTLRGD